jgi:hypothetical protein
MPNIPQINPFNYNIDKFDSGILGPITDTNFRDYLLTHNLGTPNPVISSVLSNPWADRGTEYDVSQSTFNVIDVPNLTTVANTPSVFNNLTNPRQVNVGSNLQNINPQVQANIGQTTPIQAGQGTDASTQINQNPSNIDVPGLQTVANTPSVYNNLTNPRQLNVNKNLQDINPQVANVLGQTTPEDAGQGNDATFNSNTSNIDVPGLQTVANTPSVYNNLTNPRQLNVNKNLQDINPQVANVLGQTTPQQAGLGQDATSLFNSNVANLDLPSVQEASEISSTINNFTQPRPDNLALNPTEEDLLNWYPVEFAAVYQQWSGDYNTPYGVPQTLKLSFAGNINSWVKPGGQVITTREIRDRDLLTKANNKYGPTQIISYGTAGDVLLNDRTGFVSYNPGIQGDFRDQLFSRTLGVGVIPFSTIGSGINYKPDGTNISELDTIARKRRGVEVLNRIKLNFTDNTIGVINTSPIGLLTGQDLIIKNYSITSRKTAIGKAAEFLAKLTGFNNPNSILDAGDFNLLEYEKSIQVGRAITENRVNYKEVDISSNLLDQTGKHTRNLIIDTVNVNKYGPTLENNYAKYNQGNYFFPSETEKGGPVPQEGYTTSPAVEGFFGKTETAGALNSKSQSDLLGFQDLDGPLGLGLELNAGYDTKYQGTFGENIDEGFTTENYSWTPRTIAGSNSNQTVNPFKRGLLKYTQEIVNKSEGLNDVGSYIGYFDSPKAFGGNKEYNQKFDKHGHATGQKEITTPLGGTIKLPGNLPSKGNTTKDSTGEYYCRSWSSKRKYASFENLIRGEKNWWLTTKPADVLGSDVPSNYSDLMTLNEVGMPKIAWEKDGVRELQITTDYESQSKGKSAVDALKNLAGFKPKVIPYMFSIENLAWVDAPQSAYLPLCEKGPNGGRIMWFPPYNIDFSESTSVNWDPTTMVGRGEPIYTYNNTERSGSLSFSIVVDHPSVLNKLRKDYAENIFDDVYHSFFAGCGNTDAYRDFIPPVRKDSTIEIPNTGVITPEVVKPKEPNDPPYTSFKVYFDNAFSDSKCPRNKQTGQYEECKGVQYINTTSQGRTLSFTYEENDLVCNGNSRPGLNKLVENKLAETCQFLVGKSGLLINPQSPSQPIFNQKYEEQEDGKNYTIQLYGYCSGAANKNYNLKLSHDRILSVYNWMIQYMESIENGDPVKFGGSDKTYPAETTLRGGFDDFIKSGQKGLRWEFYSLGDSASDPNSTNEEWAKEDTTGQDPCTSNQNSPDSLASKQARFVEVRLIKNPLNSTRISEQINNENQIVAQEKTKEEQAKKEAAQSIADSVAKSYIGECDYFQALKKSDSFIYNTLGEKLDNFHPAFHAITPEGFNSRLTFLQQCTRQGPQLIDINSPQNMIFGRPPICVLKIGDFYHTKIVIDSVNFSFEPVQWDLNPEGIGVQPMVVKVDMGFKFIGGSSLGGPIKQLQNAVSFNFFANTGIYNTARAVDNYLAQREGALQKKVVYGGYITPGQENALYDVIKQSSVMTDKKTDTVTPQPKAVDVPSTNAQTSPAVVSATTQDQKTDVKKSAVANKPATTVVGNKLENVRFECSQNFTSGNWTIGSFNKSLSPISANKTVYDQNATPKGVVGFGFYYKDYVTKSVAINNANQNYSNLLLGSRLFVQFLEGGVVNFIRTYGYSNQSENIKGAKIIRSGTYYNFGQYDKKIEPDGKVPLTIEINGVKTSNKSLILLLNQITANM